MSDFKSVNTMVIWAALHGKVKFSNVRNCTIGQFEFTYSLYDRWSLCVKNCKEDIGNSDDSFYPGYTLCYIRIGRSASFALRVLQAAFHLKYRAKGE